MIYHFNALYKHNLFCKSNKKAPFPQANSSPHGFSVLVDAAVSQCCRTASAFRISVLGGIGMYRLRLFTAPVKSVSCSIRQPKRWFSSIKVHALHRCDSWRLVQLPCGWGTCGRLPLCLKEQGQRREDLGDVRSSRDRAFSPPICLKYASGALEHKLATLRAGMRNNISLVVIIRQMVSSLLHPICTIQSCCAKDEYSVAQELPGRACKWGKMVSCFVETLLCSLQKYSFQGNDFLSPVRLKHRVWDNFSNVSKRRRKLWIWLRKGE